MSAEHVVTPAHAAALVEYVSFLRRKREGCVSEVAAEFKELREMRERLDGCGASSAVPCLEAVMERVRSAAQRALGGGVLYPCGSLLIRLAHPHAASLVAPWGGTVQVPPCECLRPLP